MEWSKVKYIFDTKGQITHFSCLHYVDARCSDKKRFKKEKSESHLVPMTDLLCLTLNLYG